MFLVRLIVNSDSKFNFKAIGIISLVILVLIFTLQNIETVTVKFLWFDFSMSRAVLVITLFVLGFIIGKFSNFKTKKKLNHK